MEQANLEPQIQNPDFFFDIANWEKGMNVVHTGVTLLCVRNTQWHQGHNLYSTTRTIQVAVGFNLRTTAAKAINSMITVNSGISTSYWEQTFKTNLLHVKNVVVHIYFERHAFNCQNCSCIFYMIMIIVARYSRFQSSHSEGWKSLNRAYSVRRVFFP